MGLIEIIGLVAMVIVKAIPFVEELMRDNPNSGAAKAAMVMNMAQIAVSGVEGAIIKNNPQWAYLAPLAKRFIDDAIATMNAIEAQKTAEK